MKESDNTEEQVIQRYIELAGLIRDGVMVNKDKERRAREYVKSRAAFVKQALEQDQIRQNSKYGELIVQANEVQYYLTVLILLRLFSPTKKMEKNLERMQFGQLIGYMSVCAKNEVEFKMVDSLEEYKESRDALAHKMFTDKKLTPRECDIAIKLGKELISNLKSLIYLNTHGL